MALPFDDQVIDCIACQFGTMFFPDKVLSYKEAARVLKPGGQYVFNTWGTLQQCPFAQAAIEASAQFFTGAPPGFYKVPFSYADPDVVTADIANAGFQNIQAEQVCIQKTVAEPAEFARGLVFGNPLIDEITQHGGIDPQEVAIAIHQALLDRFGNDPMSMPLLATVFTATAP